MINKPNVYSIQRTCLSSYLCQCCHIFSNFIFNNRIETKIGSASEGTNAINLFFRAIGAVVIVAGLYMVIWGKSKDYDSSQLDDTTAGTNKVVVTDHPHNNVQDDQPNTRSHPLENQDICV